MFAKCVSAFHPRNNIFSSIKTVAGAQGDLVHNNSVRSHSFHSASSCSQACPWQPSKTTSFGNFIILPYNSSKMRRTMSMGSDASGLVKPFKAEITKIDYDKLHGDIFLVIVADPLNQFVVQKQADWEEVRESFSPNQRLFYGFWHADEVISTGGFLPFFYMGRGEVFDDFRSALLHVQDKEMENIVVRAVREIEEPNNWEIFSRLKDELDDKGVPRSLLDNERLKSIFDPLQKLYMERRPITLDRIEQLVRRHNGEFLSIR